MAPSPSPRNAIAQGTPARTPSSRFRLNFPSRPSISPSPNVAIVSTEHPVEVIGRIRDYPDRKEKQSAIQVLPNGTAVRVKTDLGYRDFSLDGISVAENEDLDAFYKKFVEPRVYGVKTGGKCTIMMYGPTGSGKSHTMFGCAKEPGIVYRALQNILGDSDEGGAEGGVSGQRFKVKVTVLEIYNEEIYDLLAGNASSGVNIGWPKNAACKVRLEVMGKKAKNAMFISGSEAGKIAKEVAKVEKRRVVKNTLCNDRSSRSHCLITLDVPAVGGRLMLVDMAGSENIDQAGLLGSEAKLQSAKINHGNIALRRVVEAIANGDSYVPFRDSKLTMLLQDSFEDDGAKILMVLCASPDQRDIHKTVATLEYGAKAKCIVRFPNSPSKEKPNSEDLEAMVLGSRIVAMDEYILKLQMDNKLKEKEKEAAHRELLQKEEEVAKLKAKLEEMEETKFQTKEDIDSRVEEKARLLRLELERKFEECQKSADTFVEVGKKKMEEKILQQQEEVEVLRQRLEEIESELQHMKSNPMAGTVQGTDAAKKNERTSEIGEAGELVAKTARLLEGMQTCVQQQKDKFIASIGEVEKLPNCMASEEGRHINVLLKVIPDSKKSLHSLGLAKNSDVHTPEDSNASSKPKSDSKTGFEEHCPIEDSFAPSPDHVKNLFNSGDKDERFLIHQRFPFLRSNSTENYGSSPYGDDKEGEEDDGVESTRFVRRAWLPTVYEVEEEDMKDDDDREHPSDKQVTCNDSNHITSGFVEPRVTNGCSLEIKEECGTWAGRLAKPGTDDDANILDKNAGTGLWDDSENERDAAVARRTRIQNIFLLCGNHRELAHQARKAPADKRYKVEGVISDPIANVLDETPKVLDFMTLPRSPSRNSTISLEKHTSSLGLEVAESVIPAIKAFSPQEYKVPSMSSSPVTNTKQDHRSPNKLVFGHVEAGSTAASTSECSDLDSPILALAEEKSTLPSHAQVNSALICRDSPGRQTDPSTEMKEHITREEQDQKCDVYVKWETSKEVSGKLIKILEVPKSANLMDLRRMIEPHVGDLKQDFIFLMLGDPSGAPVSREKEANVQITSLPDCHNQRGSRLACLRLPSKRSITLNPNHCEMPFSSIENKLPVSVPTNNNFQYANCGPCDGLRPLSKMGHQTVDLGGKTGQKVATVAQMNGLRQ